MNSFKTSLIAKSIAAACCAAGLANPAGALEANILGTPDDGMVCRSGYGALFSAGNIKCSKSQSINVVLECLDPKFPTYVNHSAPNGKHKSADVCTMDSSRPGFVAITVTTDLTNLTESVNGSPGVYTLANVNPATVATRIGNLDLSEAAALGLSAGGVDTVAGLTTVNRDFTLGVKDNASVLVTYYTFAVPAGGLIGNQGPIGLPATANSTSAFVPRPLPR
jgi:hypothetical protein